MRHIVIGLWLLPFMIAACTGQAPNITPSRPNPPALDHGQCDDQSPVLNRALTERLKIPSRFDVDREGRQGDWTLVCGRPRTSTGQEIDYRQTNLRERAREGTVDDRACALLQQTGSGVVVHELSAGDTDMGFIDWPARHGLSDDILNMRHVDHEEWSTRPHC